MLDWFGLVELHAEPGAILYPDLYPAVPLHGGREIEWHYLPTGQLIYGYISPSLNGVVFGIIDGEHVDEIQLNVEITGDMELIGWGEFNINEIPDFNKVITKSRGRKTYVIPNLKPRTFVKNGERMEYPRDKCVCALMKVRGNVIVEGKLEKISADIYLEFRWRNRKLELGTTSIVPRSMLTRYYLTNEGYYRIIKGSRTLSIKRPKQQRVYKHPFNTYTYAYKVSAAGNGIVISYETVNSTITFVGILPETTFVHTTDYGFVNYAVDRHYLLYKDDESVNVYNMITNQRIMRMDKAPCCRPLAWDERHNMMLFDGYYGIEGIRHGEHLVLHDLAGRDYWGSIENYQWYPHESLLVFQYETTSDHGVAGLQIVVDD